jgi:hypothetical protein
MGKQVSIVRALKTFIPGIRETDNLKNTIVSF